MTAGWRWRGCWRGRGPSINLPGRRAAGPARRATPLSNSRQRPSGAKRTIQRSRYSAPPGLRYLTANADHRDVAVGGDDLVPLHLERLVVALALALPEGGDRDQAGRRLLVGGHPVGAGVLGEKLGEGFGALGAPDPLVGGDPGLHRGPGGHPITPPSP